MPSETSETIGAGHTDIRQGDWIDRHLPPHARPYARLARLDRPIGTWLLLLPGLWSIALAAEPGHLPKLWLMLLFAVGSVVMRGAGCTINDIIDRKFDALVERTRVRPIPSGAVSVPQAIAFLIAQCLVGLGVLVQMNRATIVMGAASLVLVATYPLMKRITWWPQAFLGLTFNWGALLGWVAVRGDLAWPPVLLYAGGILWTLGYDTIYAHQDREDDVKVGVKSTALRLGAASKRWILGFYAGATALWALALMTAGIHPLAHLGVALTGGMLLRQAWQWRPQDPADSLAAFRAARIAGWVLLASIILGMAAAS
ncbi:4-hydroxybenzoate octaprenyltransferase [Nitrospirillum sp. BR 11164]|uniref:4-hydroxybenzoate octaprenyltransferase n=1 Tax=Nitrospirillum sp. BR 11164 TaxID=3104324 RepID=UPI002AFE79B6|nr:4-hydroxybenzoate octaprenyltransferase [Nitrospirillum sp. BR 11164]MEA1650154.1 4-hydroxybenzoate octaprenyltransferase [Nitrospirillum sp. BR 11164]